MCILKGLPRFMQKKKMYILKGLLFATAVMTFCVVFRNCLGVTGRWVLSFLAWPLSSFLLGVVAMMMVGVVVIMMTMAVSVLPFRSQFP